MPVWDIPQRKADFTPDALLELRSPSAAVLSATEVAGGTPKRIHGDVNLGYQVAVVAQAYTGFTEGVNFWAIAIEVSDGAAGVFREVARTPLLDGAAFKGRIGVHSSVVMAAGSNMQHMRTRAIKTGTPGNLSYYAYITQDLH